MATTMQMLVALASLAALSLISAANLPTPVWRTQFTGASSGSRLQRSSTSNRRLQQATDAAQCPPVPWPFGLTSDTAAAPEFVVLCLSDGTLHLEHGDLNITKFADGYVETNDPVFSKVYWTLAPPPPPPPPPPAFSCPEVPWPFGYGISAAASAEFLVECRPTGYIFLPSSRVTITSFGAGFITIQEVLYSRACNQVDNSTTILDLSDSFSLAQDNVLALNGSLPRGRLADSQQNMMPFRSEPGPLGQSFVHQISLGSWGDCGGAYLRGPTGNCTWGGWDATPEGPCEVKLQYAAPRPPAKAGTPSACPTVPYPFSYNLSSAASIDFLVQCLPSGQIYLPSIDVIITSFGQGSITIDKKLFSRACNRSTRVVSALNLTSSFYLAPENILDVNGTLGRGLVADSRQNMFQFRSSPAPLGQPFYDEVTVAGWGDCGGSYLRGPTGNCWWDGTTAPPVGACEVQVNYLLPTQYPPSPPAATCPAVAYPFSYNLSSAASIDFLVQCLPSGQIYLPSIDVIITSFGQGSITIDKKLFSRACNRSTRVVSALNLTSSFYLAPENILDVNGTLGRGLVADSRQNMFQFRSSPAPLGQPFYDEVTVAGWGDCGGSYLRGPTGNCWWDGTTAPPVGACEVQVNYLLPTQYPPSPPAATCPAVAYPFSYNLSSAASIDFLVQCLPSGQIYLPSIDVIITSFGQGSITIDKKLFSRACNRSTRVVSALNLTSSFYLAPENILDVNGTLGRGLVADSRQNMFQFRSSPAPLGQPFYDEVTVAGWGDCGGSYLRGPTGNCWWDGTTAPPVGACEVQVNYLLPTQYPPSPPAATCPAVAYPFSYNLSSAASIDFLVQCLPSGQIYLPSIDVIITSFGQGSITIDKKLFSRACNRSTRVVSALNLTSSFYLAPENILDVNGTLGRGLVADSRQNMFPFRSSPAPLGQPFYDEVTVAGWGDCGGSYLRGPTGNCWWDGTTAPPVGACEVQVNYLLPTQYPPSPPAATCPAVAYPFSYNLSSAASIDFLVQCLPSGQIYLPSIDVIITSFGQGSITIDKKLFSRACNRSTRVVSALNLTSSFYLAPENILDVNGTLGRGLVADSRQNMFPFRSSPAPLGQLFYDEVTVAGWGDCGGSYLRGPTGNCWWDGTTAPPVGACEVQVNYLLPTQYPPSPPAATCPAVAYPFSYNLSSAASIDFLVQCLPSGQIYLPSIDVIITSFGQGSITIDKKLFSRACNRSTRVVSALNLTSSFYLAPENILDVNGTLGRGLVADSRQNMFPFRSSPAPLGQPFYDEVTVAGWGDCGGSYLRGPTGNCWWDGTTAPPVGACEVQVNYLLPTQYPPSPPAATCPAVAYPFSYNLSSAASIDFLVQCLPSGQIYLPSIDVIITSFGQGSITIDKKLFSRACNRSTRVVSALNLTSSFYLAPENILDVNGTLGRGLVADSRQNMFQFRSSPAPLGQPFYDEVTVAGWGDCGGSYLRGPTGNCWWDGTTAPPVGACQVQVNYLLPTQYPPSPPAATCPAVAYPFSYNLSSAASIDFLVQCLPSGQIYLPSIDVIITSFGQGSITIDKKLFSRACNRSTRVVSALNLTSSFYLAPENILDVNGTLGRGLVADSRQNMFPFRSSPAPLGQPFYDEVTVAGWGDCGGSYLRGPTGNCWWDGTTAPPVGACQVQVNYLLPTQYPPSPPAATCPAVAYPFSYNLSSAASIDFLVQCLPSGQIYLPSIDVIITSFGQGSITIDKKLFSRACNRSTRVVSALNLTSSFYLAPENILDVNGTLGRGLVADSRQNMFQFRSSPAPLGQPFYDEVTVAGWGDCGGSYLRGPTGNCWWDGTTAPPVGACQVQVNYLLPTQYPPSPPAATCPAVAYPFSYNLSSAASIDFLVQCLPSGQIYLPSIDVIITSFGQGSITIDKKLFSRACNRSTRVVSALNLTSSFYLAPENILDVNGTLGRGLVADSRQNMFQFRSSPAPLGQPFYDEVTVAGWGDCGGSYLRGPTGNCWWDGTTAPPVGACQVQVNYLLPTQYPPSPPAATCPAVAYPFSYNLSSAASIDFLVQCLPSGQIYLPSIDVIITSFGQGSITIDKKLFSRACNRSTRVVSALNLTSSFYLAPENILDVNGTLGRGLVADSRQNMFQFRSSPAPLGQPFYDEVTVAGWGDCGGSYLRGPTGNCWWDGTTAPPVGACQVQVNYLLPTQYPPSPPAATCPAVAYPFSYNLSSAASIDFLVQCLPSGQIYLPSIDVIITSFGQGSITIDKKLFSRSCNLQSHVVSALNLTSSFTLSPLNILDVNGTDARGLVADSLQNMFPFRNTAQPLGQPFQEGVVLVAVGDCGGAYLRGPNGRCRWAGGTDPPQGPCDVRVDWQLPSNLMPPPQ